MNSRKAHYFRESRSLCGQWVYFGSSYTQNQKPGSPDDCAECARRRTKEVETGA